MTAERKKYKKLAIIFVIYLLKSVFQAAPLMIKMTCPRKHHVMIAIWLLLASYSSFNQVLAQTDNKGKHNIILSQIPQHWIWQLSTSS